MKKLFIKTVKYLGELKYFDEAALLFLLFCAIVFLAENSYLIYLFKHYNLTPKK